MMRNTAFFSLLTWLITWRKNKATKNSTPDTSQYQTLDTDKTLPTVFVGRHAAPTVHPDPNADSKDMSLVSLDDKPPAYNTNRDKKNDGIYKPDVLDFIKKTVNTGFGSELKDLSLNIHDHPELSNKEALTHDLLAKFMESQGFEVKRHYLLPTALRAEFSLKSGGRTIGCNSEMDALPGMGHACGHNLIAMCGVGIALTLKAVIQKYNLPGKVVWIGTPAEEDGGGKVQLLKLGAYENLDICLMSHPGEGLVNSTALSGSLAVRGLHVEYAGQRKVLQTPRVAPWDGKNALDAAVLAYQGIGLLRQQIRPECRVQAIIEGKGWAVNVIPDWSAVDIDIRAPDEKSVNDLLERVKNCATASAGATGCSIKFTDDPVPYLNLRQNTALGKNYTNIMSSQFGWTIGSPNDIVGATDFGNVTYELPGIHPGFVIPTEPGGGNHTAAFAKAAGTPEAQEITLKVVQGLAHTGFRALDDDAFFKEVRAAFHGRDFQ